MLSDGEHHFPNYGTKTFYVDEAETMIVEWSRRVLATDAEEARSAMENIRLTPRTPIPTGIDDSNHCHR